MVLSYVIERIVVKFSLEIFFKIEHYCSVCYSLDIVKRTSQKAESRKLRGGEMPTETKL